MDPKRHHDRLLLQLARETQRNHGRISKVVEGLQRHRGYLRSTIEKRLPLKADFLCEVLAELGTEPRVFFAQAYEIVPTCEELLAWQEKPGAARPALRRIEEATLRLEAEGPAAGDPSAATRPSTATRSPEKLKRFARTRRANQRSVLRQADWARNPEVLRRYLLFLDATRTDRAPDVAAVAETVAVEIIPSLACPQEERLTLQCLATGIFGSAKRVTADYPTAARALGFALKLAGRHGLETTRAGLLRRGAILLRDEGKFDPALALLQDALNIYSENGLPAEYGKTLIDRAVVFSYGGDHMRAERVYRSALTFLQGDDESQKQNRLAAAQGIFHSQLDKEDLEEAQRWLEHALELVDPEDSGSMGRLLWEKGQLQFKREHYGEAQVILSEARTILLKKENPIQGALVGLDLAKALLAQGKTQEVLDLAMEMNPLLFAFKHSKVAEAAVGSFIRAALQGQVTEELIDRSASRLSKACSPARARPGEI